MRASIWRKLIYIEIIVKNHVWKLKKKSQKDIVCYKDEFDKYVKSEVQTHIHLIWEVRKKNYT